MNTSLRASALSVALLLAGSCAGLGLADIIKAPQFSVASGQQAELRLLGPSSDRPYGGAAVRLWARVENPNPLSLTLSSLAGNLFLEGTQAANVSLPLGLPLVANQDTVIPIDISLSFSDLPRLRDAALKALGGSPLSYRLDGTVTVDAGPLGQPSFGPNTLLRGQVDVRR